MTYPRRLCSGVTHAITRRTANRCLFLTPTDFVNQVTAYCLGVAAERYEEETCLLAFMSEVTHYHMDLADTHRPQDVSRVPDFLRDFNSNLARALNTHYGRGGSFWCGGSYSNTEIHTERSLIRQLLYLWTQPVKDGLVADPYEWPGFKIMPEDFGTEITVDKPEGAYFGGYRGPETAAGEFGLEPWQGTLAREQQEAEALLRSQLRGGAEAPPAPPKRSRTKTPDSVTFRVGVPPGYEDWPIDKVRRHFRKLLDREVELIHAERLRRGKRRYMGLPAIFAQDPRDAAGSNWPSFSLNPRIACAGDVEQRVELLIALREWRAAHRRAYEALRDGKRGRFPPGTYGRVRFPRSCVRPKPPPDLAA